MAKRIMKLTDLEVSEISLVDAGANQHAKVALFKHEGGATKMETDATEDMLARRAAARQALVDSIESILGDPDFNTEEANNQLIDTVSQYIVFTGSISGKFGGSRSGPGAPKAPTMFSPNQSPDIIIAETVKRAAAGEPTKLSKTFFEGIARIYAKREQKAGETEIQTRARFHETEQGRLIRKAAERAPAVVEVAKRAPERGPAMAALHKRADQIGPTRHKGVAKIAESRDPTDRALWQAANAEEKARAAVA